MSAIPNLPLQEWIGRGLLPTTLSSAELSRIESALRRQAVFSARTDYADYLQFLQKEIAPILAGQMDAVTVTLRLKQILETMDYSPRADELDTIKDLSSWERRKLVVETNVAVARGAGQYAAQQSGGALDAYPAWELVRLAKSRQPRAWAKRFLIAARAAGDEAALRVFGETGRMMAMKTSDTWGELGSTENFEDALGNAFPPFAWGSNEGTKQVPYSVCVNVGLIERGAPRQGTSVPANGDFRQSPRPVVIQPAGKIPAGLSPEYKAALIASLGDGYRFDQDGVLTA